MSSHDEAPAEVGNLLDLLDRALLLADELDRKYCALFIQTAIDHIDGPAATMPILSDRKEPQAGT